jgi:hypothetical protein
VVNIKNVCLVERSVWIYDPQLNIPHSVCPARRQFLQLVVLRPSGRQEGIPYVRRRGVQYYQREPKVFICRLSGYVCYLLHHSEQAL